MAKWVTIYKDKMLSRGEYRGELYDIGFDRPETHAIAKEKKCTTPSTQTMGAVELRGLENRDYHVVDYETGKDLGTVHGPKATIPAHFDQHLLLEAHPQ